MTLRAIVGEALALLGGDARRLLSLVVRRAAEARALDPERAGLRVFEGWGAADLLDRGAEQRLSALDVSRPEIVSDVLEAIAPGRKRSGVFFTPPQLTRQVVDRALALAPRSVCDPAVGGGVFLLEVGRRLAEAQGVSLRVVAEQQLFGIDVSPLAIAAAEAALWLCAGDPDWNVSGLRARLVVGDALFTDVGPFDLVIGNPPWVAYAGRAAQPLEPARRKQLVRSFESFKGYPTLHGLFVERAAALAPEGTIALLLPSPVADLAGYAPVRRVLARTHSVADGLLEFGQDAFEGVVQPCFALIATPGADPRGEHEWRLDERQRSSTVAERVEPPRALESVAARPPLPPELFGERGFQSSGDVSKTLFLRAPEPDERHTVPLLEGKNVSAFREDPPRLFLAPDREVLARARCRLRPAEDYERVAFVVRQTAVMPIAALHGGLPFRNTLLAGFAHPELSPELLVALLNSTLYRALHVARRRDARQAAFPQVKIAHLRALPRPPDDPARFARLCELTLEATRGGPTAEHLSEIDALVFDLFDVSADARAATASFLSDTLGTKRSRPARAD